MRGLLRIYNTSKFLFPKKKVCKAVVEESLKKGKQSLRGWSWLLQEPGCQQLLIPSFWSCLGGLLCTITLECWQLRWEMPCSLSEGGRCDSLQGCSPPTLRRNHQCWAPGSGLLRTDAVFPGWWHILRRDGSWAKRLELTQVRHEDDSGTEQPWPYASPLSKPAARHLRRGKEKSSGET